MATSTPGRISDPGYPYARDSWFVRSRQDRPRAVAVIRAYSGWETCLPQTMWETGVPPSYQEAFEASLSEADPDGPEPEAGQ